MFFHVFFLFPETAGKTLEETEAMFEDPNGIPYLGTPAWKTKVEFNRARQMERGDLEDKAHMGLAVHEEQAKQDEKREVQEQTTV